MPYSFGAKGIEFTGFSLDFAKITLFGSHLDLFEVFDLFTGEHSAKLTKI